MIIAGTGHRPDKLGGYREFNERVFPRLVDLAVAALKRYSATEVISGMAQGWDQALANGAIKLGIPFVAAIPCDGQDSLWPDNAKERYRNLLAKAKKIQMCGPGGPYAPWKMQYRNTYMVDSCELLLALWDGSKGGTANCVSYAIEVNRQIINLWRSWEKYNAQ